MPRRFRRGSKPVHPVKWCSMNPIRETGTLAGPTTTQRTICSAADLEEFTNPTIVRIRGSSSFHLKKSDSNEPQAIEVAWGIQVVDQNLLNPGSLLTKDIAEGPWLVFEYIRLWSVIIWSPLPNSSGVNQGDAPNAMTVAGLTHLRLPVDVKAMRRVPRNHTLVSIWTADNVATGSAGGAELEVVQHFRVLVKE